MELDYRTVFQVRSQFGKPPVQEVNTALYEWLKSKRLDADLLELGVTELGTNTVATLARIDQRDGTVVERFRLTEVRLGAETAAPQTWTTEVLTYQHPDGRSADVLVHVADPRENTPGSRPGPTGVPGIVRRLLDTFQATDGTMVLHDGPAVLDIHDEDLVHDMLVDDTRRNLLILAPAATGRPFDDFVRQVKDLTFGTVGQAGTFVLTAALVERLAGHTGYLNLPPGGMRVFPPGIDPAARTSAGESYFITADRIAERDRQRVGRHWTWIAREHGNTQPWPRRLQRVMRAVTEHERDTLLADIDAFLAERAARTNVGAGTHVGQIVDAVEVVADNVVVEVRVAAEPSVLPVDAQPVEPLAGPPAVPEASTKPDDAPLVDAELALCEALTRALPTSDVLATILLLGGCATVTESLQFALLLAGDYDQLQAKVTALTSGMSAAEDTDADLERLLDVEERLRNLQAENEELESRLDRENRASRYLRNQLVRAGEADVAYSSPDGEELAQDFDTVLEVLGNLPFVVFTGDMDRLLDLNEMRGSRPTAKKAHRALCALNDYARAKREGAYSGGSFLDYNNDPPHGFATISRASIAAAESETVQRSKTLKRYRMLPMPDGTLVYMDAHIRLSQESTTAPRLYFQDDTAKSGVMVVGYIGAHLPNTLTN